MYSSFCSHIPKFQQGFRSFSSLFSVTFTLGLRSWPIFQRDPFAFLANLSRYHLKTFLVIMQSHTGSPSFTSYSNASIFPSHRYVQGTISILAGLHREASELSPYKAGRLLSTESSMRSEDKILSGLTQTQTNSVLEWKSSNQSIQTHRQHHYGTYQAISK